MIEADPLARENCRSHWLFVHAMRFYIIKNACGIPVGAAGWRDWIAIT